MSVVVPKRVLLELTVLISYGMAFNALNAELDAIQRKHFEQHGKSIDKLRDPFVPYDTAEATQAALYAYCGITTQDEAFDWLNHNADDDSMVTVDREWVISAMHEAITRYGERHMFLMLDKTLQAQVRAYLGEAESAALYADLRALTQERLICGNADNSLLGVEHFLLQQGAAYTPPPHPYKAKLNALYADVRRHVAAYRHPKGKTLAVYHYATQCHIKRQALLWANILVDTKNAALARVLTRRLNTLPPKTGEALMKVRLFGALQELSVALKNVPNKDKVPLVYACMLGDIDMLFRLLGRRAVPDFIKAIPGIDVTSRGAVVVSYDAAMKQLAWMFMCIAYPGYQSRQ